MASQEEQWLLQEKYNGQKTKGFLADCARLAAGEPLAYVIGSIPFLNCTISLDSKPLIPRPETEYWAEHVIREIKTASHGTAHVLDLCAGSGCIGVAVARAAPSARVDFVEIDTTHHPTILKNYESNVRTTYDTKIFGGDLLTEIPKDTPYDYILSNPPYIDKKLDRVDISVATFEPDRALYGGKEGLQQIKEIIFTAPTYLKPAGELWLEHEPEQTATIANLASNCGFSCRTYRDQYAVERYSRLVLQ